MIGWAYTQLNKGKSVFPSLCLSSMSYFLSFSILIYLSACDPTVNSWDTSHPEGGPATERGLSGVMCLMCISASLTDKWQGFQRIFFFRGFQRILGRDSHDAPGDLKGQNAGRMIAQASKHTLSPLFQLWHYDTDFGAAQCYVSWESSRFYSWKHRPSQRKPSPRNAEDLIHTHKKPTLSFHVSVLTSF